MAHCIGHSKLKKSYYIGVFERKSIIGELEANLDGGPIYVKNSEVSVVSLEAHYDEDITLVAKASKIN